MCREMSVRDCLQKLKSSDPNTRRIGLTALHDKIPNAGAWKLDAEETKAVLDAFSDVKRIAISADPKEWKNNKRLAKRIVDNLSNGPEPTAQLFHRDGNVRFAGLFQLHRLGEKGTPE